MEVPTVLMLLAMASIGLCISNANSMSIDPDSFEVGTCAIAKFTAPPTGRVSINLYGENDDILLLVDYRVNWGLTTNAIVLNTRTAGKWGEEQHVTGMTSTPGTLLEIIVCAEANDFSVIFNELKVANYQYRIKAPVTKIEYQKYSYDSVVKELVLQYYW